MPTARARGEEAEEGWCKSFGAYRASHPALAAELQRRCADELPARWSEAADTIVAEVVEADAVVKGQTASSSFKPAVLDNGVKVLVPPHIEAGTRIVVRIADGTYLERAKD